MHLPGLLHPIPQVGSKGGEERGGNSWHVSSSKIQRTPHPTFHRKSSPSEPPLDSAPLIRAAFQLACDSPCSRKLSPPLDSASLIRAAFQLACDSPCSRKLSATVCKITPEPCTRLVNQSSTWPLWEWQCGAGQGHNGRVTCLDWAVDSSMVRGEWMAI